MYFLKLTVNYIKAWLKKMYYRKLSLSTNMIEKVTGLNSLKKLRILSLGRNYIKSFSGMVRSLLYYMYIFSYIAVIEITNCISFID